MIETKITEDTFILLAMHNYDNLQCVSLSEFEEDLKRFSYLKKLFARYKENNDLKERLILNHIIVLFNLFGIITVDFLFFKIDRQYWNSLATFLIYLGRMPESLPEFGLTIHNIEIDQYVLDQLRKI